MAETKTLLKPDKFYHIFNHAVGEENFFNNEENYKYFLHKLKEYLQNYIDFYAYCLMANHFHLIIKIKVEERILAEYRKKVNYKESKTKEEYFIPNLISRQFSNLFNSYAQAYNKENNRKGSLFNNRFKREEILNDKYLRNVIIYTHNNPVQACITEHPAEWKFSSYNSINSKSSTIIKRNEVVELFEDIDNFNYCHLYNI